MKITRTLALAAAASAMGAAAAQRAIDAAQQVVVSATRHAMALADAPAAMSVVSAEAIAQRGADNLLQALRGETGITLFGRTISGRKTISLRGMDPRHTLVLVDGKRISASDGVVGHSDFQLDWVGPVDIERIEVIRGPMSVLYGAEALGGVVQVITKPLPDRFEAVAFAEGSAAAGTAGGDGYRAAATLRTPLAADWRLGVSAGDSRRQALASSDDARISAIEGRHKREASLRLAWQPTRGHQFDAETRIGREDRWADVRERSGARRYHQSLHDIDRSHASLAWTADWGGPQAIESRLQAYGSRLDVSNLKTNGVASLRPQTLDDRVFDGQASAQPIAGQRITAGFEWRDETLDNQGLPGGSGQARHRALFVQDELAAGKTLALTAGLRLDEHSRFGRQWSPRAYAVWQAAPGWVVKGGIGSGFKAPSIKQITAEYREDEGPNTFIGNPLLQPELNRSAEIGLAWDARPLGASLMVFHNRVRDLIVNRLISGSAARGTYVFENIDRAVLEGVEAEVAWREGGFVLQANATWLDARDGNGARLEKRPRLALGLRGEYGSAAWRLGLAIEHQAGQLLASLTPGQPPQPVPDLTFVGLYGSWSFAPGWTLRGGVDNASNVVLARKSALYTYSEWPRLWRLSVTARW